MKIIVIGRNGQLAWELARLNSDTHQILCLGRDDIDLSNEESILHSLIENSADAVINTAAYTAVDMAETDIDDAYLLNKDAVGMLANACSKLSIHLVQVSTDFVFSGEKSTPYLTTDSVKPMSVYGASKAAGEQLLLDILPNESCIIRTSWVYSVHGNNFVKTMLRLMSEKSELGIISDQIGSPTSATPLAKACLHASVNRIKGIHHWTDAGVASWYDFAVAIQQIAVSQKLLISDTSIKPISTDEYPTPAHRPSYSVLNKSSLSENFSCVDNRHWRLELEAMLINLKP